MDPDIPYELFQNELIPKTLWFIVTQLSDYWSTNNSSFWLTIEEKLSIHRKARDPQ
jgi:hypothetical protein